MAWQDPITNWTADKNVHRDDFNRIEGNTKNNHDRLNQIDPNGDGKVSNAEYADNANTANHATNAASIGGMPASEIARCKTGYYWGSGAANSQIINVGFTPKLLNIIYKVTAGVVRWVAMGPMDHQLAFKHYREYNDVITDVTLITNGFQVGPSVNGSGTGANGSGRRYIWTAIG